MNKSETASYLVSLHNLIEAQMKSVHSVPNQTLAQEYEKHWIILKDQIAKENEDEARKRQIDDRRPSPNADQPQSESGRGESNWNSRRGESALARSGPGSYKPEP